MENLISLTGDFLTATGLFFAALGSANKENDPLKFFLSASALCMSGIWLWVAIILPFEGNDSEMEIRSLLAILLPSMFILGWCISLGVHGYRWLVREDNS